MTSLALVLLAVGGHLCALRLIDVRPYAVFQHYLPWSALVDQPLALAGIAIQALVVTIVGWQLRADIRRLFIGARPGRALLVVLFVGFGLVVPSNGIWFSLNESALAGGLALLAALNLALAALVIPEATLNRWADWVGARITFGVGASGERAWDRRLPWMAGIWIAVLSAAASYFALERLPHIDDSVSNFFQAKYFSQGLLYLPAPPDASSFQVDQTVVDQARWYGYAFPAWPAVLALGVLAGVPWLINPILGGLLIVAGHALVRGRSGRGTANLVVLMLAASPWLVFMSAEFMAQPLTALLVVVAALGLDRATSPAARWAGWALAGGVAMGALMLTRAIDGAIVVVAFALTALIDRHRTRTWGPAVVAGMAAVLIAALMFPYNKAVTGRANYPPHMAWSDSHWGVGVDRLGFGPDVGVRQWPNLDPLPGHGPADVVLNTNKNVFMTNFELFGWATGSLFFVWLGFVMGPWRRSDGLWLALTAMFVIGYNAYWFSGGPDLGARYWYPAMLPMAVLAARGVEMVAARLRASGVPGANARLAAFVAAATLSAAIAVLPWRAVTKHYRYRGITGEVRALAAERGFDHALVFVKSGENRRDYASAFVLNPPTLDDPATIYALDAGSENRARVVAKYADRPVWVIGRVRDSAGVARFEVFEGPLAPGTVPR